MSICAAGRVSGNNLSACLSSRRAFVQQAVGQMLHKLWDIPHPKVCDSRKLKTNGRMPTFSTPPSRVPTSAAVFSVAVKLLN